MTELLEKMIEGLWRNPIDPREMVLLDGEGNPVAGVTLKHLSELHWGKNNIHLEEVRAMQRGGGRKMMELLLDRADRYGAMLTGHVKPMEPVPGAGKRMTKRDLIQWYKDFGFVQERPGSADIVRMPRAGPELSGNPDDEGSDEGVVVLVDITRTPWQYVLARAAEWRSDRDKIQVWRGPDLPDETMARSDLLEAECRTVLVDSHGFYDCLEPKPSLEEELVELVQKEAEKLLNALANERAAEIWSYVGDATADDYDGRVWAVATFGDAVAVNGEVVWGKRSAKPPRGYVETDRGGTIPTGEETEIEKDWLVELLTPIVNKELGKEVHPELLRAALDRLWKKDYIYWTSDSGEAEIWASQRAIKAYEKREEERERRRLEARERAQEEARRREEAERRERIRRGGWPTPKTWSPRGELPPER